MFVETQYFRGIQKGQHAKSHRTIFYPADIRRDEDKTRIARYLNMLSLTIL